jgi:signal transduction histidine kinase
MPVTEPANQSTAPLQLVQRALPVSTAAGLLECLANSWLQASGARACHVSLVDGNRLESVFAAADRTSDLQSSTKSLSDHSRVWTAGLASDSLAAMVDDGSSLLNSVTVVPFQGHECEVGGVLLLGNFEDTATLATLADTSGLLIEQLRQTSTSPTEADSLSPTRLRDLKLEAMAEFAAGAGHEINNPVATIAGRSALLIKTETDPERRRILETIGGQAYRIRDMIGDAMTYARPPEPVLEAFEPAAEILRIGQRLLLQFSDRKVALETSLDETIQLRADREQFRVVVSCLLKNSLESVGDNGQVRIELGRMPESGEPVSQSPCPAIRLAVSDDGVGLSETEREHLFDPFYSGRQAGRGLGFGLPKCWQILRLHRGTIEAVEGSAESETDTHGLTIITLWPS